MSSLQAGSAREQVSAATASAASSNSTTEVSTGSLTSQAGANNPSGPLSSRFGFAAPRTSHEGSPDSSRPPLRSMEEEALDLPIATFENLFLGSGFR